MNDVIIQELDRLGYTVDCTCTPGISWAGNPGWRMGSKGTDWSGYGNRPFVLTYPAAGRMKKSGIMEIPVTSVRKVEHRNGFVRMEAIGWNF